MDLSKLTTCLEALKEARFEYVDEVVWLAEGDQDDWWADCDDLCLIDTHESLWNPLWKKVQDALLQKKSLH